MCPDRSSPHRETVFIVDDDASVRDSLSLMLSVQGYATATFASAEDFLNSWKPEWRGCIVADIRLEGMSGLDLQEAMRSRTANLPVIVITAHGDVAAARRAFLSRAVDFIEKPFEPRQLLAAIENAWHRLKPVDSLHASAAPSSARVPLSGREQEVMELLVNGLDNRAVASRLGISHRTVEIHKARILDKMGAKSVLDLVRVVGGGTRD
jgi:two-component system, LuxR family, response regulator FixJ